MASSRQCVLKTIGTLPYELIARAGIAQYPQGRATLALARNLPTRGIFKRLVAKLPSSPATL